MKEKKPEYKKTVITEMRSLKDAYPFDLCHYYAYLDMIYYRIIDARRLELIYE